MRGRFLSERPRLGCSRVAVATGLVLSSGAISYACIWAAYGFRFGPTPNSNELFDTPSLIDEVFRSETEKEYENKPSLSDQDLDRLARERQPRLLDRLFYWEDEHRFLPQSWLRGIYRTFGLSERRASFLMGKISMDGSWAYFPLAMLFKTPVATIAALVLGLIYLACRGWRRLGKRDIWPACALLVLPAVYMFMAMRQSVNLGIRHIFPVYPCLFILIGVTASAIWRWKPKWGVVLAGMFFLGLAGETAHAYPDFIPFFNVAAGGTSNGIHLLGDSNLDWGQDLLAVVDWQKHNPDRKLYLVYFGSIDPHFYHLHYIKAPGSQTEEDIPFPGPPAENPVLAISMTEMQGIYLTDELRAFYKPLFGHKPLAVFGGSIYLFDHVEDLFPQH